MFVTPLTLALAVTAAPLPAPAAAPRDVLKQRLAIKRPWIGPIAESPVVSSSDEDEDEYGPANVGGPGDPKTLEAARLASSDDALLDFFQKRTPPAPSREKIAELVKQLGDKAKAAKAYARAAQLDPDYKPATEGLARTRAG